MSGPRWANATAEGNGLRPARASCMCAVARPMAIARSTNRRGEARRAMSVARTKRAWGAQGLTGWGARGCALARWVGASRRRAQGRARARRWGTAGWSGAFCPSGPIEGRPRLASRGLSPCAPGYGRSATGPSSPGGPSPSGLGPPTRG
jgi:hypothetical protein